MTTQQMPDKRVWAIGFGLVAGLVAAVLTRNHPLFLLPAATAAVLGSVVGWHWARRRMIGVALAHVAEMGGVEDFLDRRGREMLTVWIPLEHQVTDDDRRFARRLGESLQEHIPRGVAGLGAIETLGHSVGVMLVGRDADTMLARIRPFFKQHCPRGTYVTRLRLVRKDDPEAEQKYETWPHPRPLFEGDQIPNE